MNKLKNTVLLFVAIFGCISCSSTEDIEDSNSIEGISFENFPKIDGSTSANCLNKIIACKLLNIPYKWLPPLVDEWMIQPDYEKIPEQHKNFFMERIQTSQTHGAFMNLIDGVADIILTHRTISPDEKAHADKLGVTLIETPVALDAFVFVVNKDNPIKSLTVEQVHKIYTGEITNWAQVGGNNTNMKIFTRPRNSGSEEVMRELVMKGLEIADFPESSIGFMIFVFMEVIDNPDGICYTFNNYKEWIARKSDVVVPKIAINGIFPDETTVKNRTYPFISEVHVAIRSDLDRNSMAYKLYKWLQTEAANAAYTESGFIPKSAATSVAKISADKFQVYPNLVGAYLQPLKNDKVVKIKM
ncbi:MAG: substrate-binding domain-containing protein [Dysgonamonadaceae bacterium]|jgi:phosphate transport system substrate-binding protein|nr:substrate-binding domain-containing protein [Dysgonamonadaceae bacterium]